MAFQHAPQLNADSAVAARRRRTLPGNRSGRPRGVAFLTGEAERARPPDSPTAYTRPVALDVEVQRLLIEDVVLLDLPDQDAKVEAKVVRDIERTPTSVIVTLRVAGRDDFVKEWPLGEFVTLVRGP